MVCNRVLRRAPCVTQEGPVVFPTCHSLHLITPNSPSFSAFMLDKSQGLEMGSDFLQDGKLEASHRLLLSGEWVENTRLVISPCESPAPNSVPGTHSQQVFGTSSWMDGWLNIRGQGFMILPGTFIMPVVFHILTHIISSKFTLNL